MRSLVASLIIVASGLGCSTATQRLPVTPEPMNPGVDLLEIGGLYNVTLIRGERPILVDTGPEGSFDDVAAALRAAGVDPNELAIVVLTHAHSDHAGNARAFQELGVPVLVHEGDAGMLRVGDHGALFATNLEAVLVQLFVPSTFPALEPELVMAGDAPFDLRAYGVAGQVMHAGGHTPGSLIVHLENGVVVLGDLVRSGWLAGLVDAGTPATHLYHQHPVEEGTAAAEGFTRDIAACADIRVAYVGHGPPIAGDALRAWASDAPAGRCPWAVPDRAR
jgi:glyoxylase-like metal-dependent hydrolase (beta-lactamase superfamily II)